MAAIAQLKAVLGMDSKEFKAGMKSATKDTSTFQSQIASVGKMLAGAFSVGAIISFSKSIITWASDISEAAQNAGVLTSEMMALNQVALQGGLNVDEMRRMLSILQVELGNAAEGQETSRKKFEDLGLSIEELATLDPASMFQKVAQAAIDSGKPIQALADIFGTKMGPKALAAIKDLAENGLPKVSQEAANAADAAEELGDRWAVAMEKAKSKTLELTMAVIDGARQAAAFVKGATGGMSTAEKAVRIGLAVPTFGASLIPSASQRGAGTAAATAEADRQAAASQASLDARRGAGASSRTAMSETARATQRRLNEEAYRKFSEQEAKSETERGKRNDTRLEAISKWREGVRKRFDLRRDFAERQARLNEQMQSLKTGNATGGAMTPDSFARIGGFFGGERPGYDVASRQLDTLKKIEALEREKVKNDKEFYESMERLNGGGL